MQCIPVSGAPMRVLSPFVAPAAAAPPVGWHSPRGMPQSPRRRQLSPCLGQSRPITLTQSPARARAADRPTLIVQQQQLPQPPPQPPSLPAPRADTIVHSSAPGASRVDEPSTSAGSLRAPPMAAGPARVHLGHEPVSSAGSARLRPGQEPASSPVVIRTHAGHEPLSSPVSARAHPGLEPTPSPCSTQANSGCDPTKSGGSIRAYPGYEPTASAGSVRVYPGYEPMPSPASVRTHPGGSRSYILDPRLVRSASPVPEFPKLAQSPPVDDVTSADDDESLRRIGQLQQTRQELERELALHNTGAGRSEDDRHRLRGLVDQVQGMLRDIISTGCVDALEGRQQTADDASHSVDTGGMRFSPSKSKLAASAPLLPGMAAPKAEALFPASPLSSGRTGGTSLARLERGDVGAGMTLSYPGPAPSGSYSLDPATGNWTSSATPRPNSVALDAVQPEGVQGAQRMIQRSPQRLKPWAWQEGPPRYRAGGDSMASNLDSKFLSEHEPQTGSGTPLQPATSSTDTGTCTPRAEQASLTSKLASAEEAVGANDNASSSSLEAARLDSRRPSSSDEPTFFERTHSGSTDASFLMPSGSEPSLSKQTSAEAGICQQQRLDTHPEFAGGLDSSYSEVDETPLPDSNAPSARGVRQSNSTRALKKSPFLPKSVFHDAGQAPRMPALSSGSPRSRTATPNQKQPTARSTPRSRRTASSSAGADIGISYPFGASDGRFGTARSGSNKSHARGNTMQQRRTSPGTAQQQATPRKNGSNSPSPSRGSTPLQKQGARLQGNQRVQSPRSWEAQAHADSRRSLGVRSESKKSLGQPSDVPMEQDRLLSARPGSSCQQSPREQGRPNEATLQARLSAAMKAEGQNLLPGAADKWKVLQLFYESIPRAHVRVERIDRVVSLPHYIHFLTRVDAELDGCEVGYYVPAGPSQLARLQESGFCSDDFEEMQGHGFGIPVYTEASDAYQRACAQYNLLEDRQGGERCLCVVLCHPDAHGGHSMENGTDAGANANRLIPSEFCAIEPEHLLVAYIIWCLQINASTE